MRQPRYEHVLDKVCTLDATSKHRDIQSYIDGFHPYQAYYSDPFYPWPRKLELQRFYESLDGTWSVMAEDALGCLFTGTGKNLEQAAFSLVIDRYNRRVCDNPYCRVHPRQEQ